MATLTGGWARFTSETAHPGARRPPAAVVRGSWSSFSPRQRPILSFPICLTETPPFPSCVKRSGQQVGKGRNLTLPGLPHSLPQFPRPEGTACAPARQDSPGARGAAGGSAHPSLSVPAEAPPPGPPQSSGPAPERHWFCWSADSWVAPPLRS